MNYEYQNEQGNHEISNSNLTNSTETYVSDASQLQNHIYMNNNLNQNNVSNRDNLNSTSNNNNNNNKNIISSIIIFIIITIILILVSILLRFSDNELNKQQNQINSNKDESIVESEKQSDDYKDEFVDDEEDIDNYKEEIIDKEEKINSDDSYIPNTNIKKRTLGQTSDFDNGISINITNSIEYGVGNNIYHNPMFIKVEISNNSKKNFYAHELSTMYSIYTENPVDFIREDFDYTSFEIVPMYLLGDELETEKSGCILRKYAYSDVGKSDGSGGFSEINYFVLRPGEQTAAYLMCYFREEIEDVKVNTIYLLKDSEEFMYFLD